MKANSFVELSGGVARTEGINFGELELRIGKRELFHRAPKSIFGAEVGRELISQFGEFEENFEFARVVSSRRRN